MKVNANQAFSLQPSPIFNLGKGFQQEAAGPVLVPISTSSSVGAHTDPSPQNTTDPTTTTGSVPVAPCSHYQSKQKSHIFVESWTTPHHTLPCRSLFRQLSHPLSPRSRFQPGCAPRECPQRLGSESPMLKHEGIFRQCQFKFAHQPYKYESPSPQDV